MALNRLYSRFLSTTQTATAATTTWPLGLRPDCGSPQRPSDTSTPVASRALYRTECVTPCFGECPNGTYCCLASNTCEPIPESCPDTTCPVGEQVNPEPGGSLNQETCEVEDADCSCTPLP